MATAKWRLPEGEEESGEGHKEEEAQAEASPKRARHSGGAWSKAPAPGGHKRADKELAEMVINLQKPTLIDVVLLPAEHSVSKEIAAAGQRYQQGEKPPYGKPHPHMAMACVEALAKLDPQDENTRELQSYLELAKDFP